MGILLGSEGGRYGVGARRQTTERGIGCMSTQRNAKKKKLTLNDRMKRIRLFASDVDGVLTDAGMYYAESGEELKKFHTRDGMGFKLLQRAGIITAVMTMEETAMVARRGEKLGIPEVHQGVQDKCSALQAIIARYGFSLEDVAFIGDDVNDLRALKAVGFSAAPADAMPLIVRSVHYVCKKKGGEGAAREVIELILQAKGLTSHVIHF